jgi:hypothetical protein
MSRALHIASGAGLALLAMRLRSSQDRLRAACPQP